MDSKRVTQWLIPFLFGMSVGMLILSSMDMWFPAPDVIARHAASLFGIGALLVAVLVKMRTGYNWPWEGTAEWSDRQDGAAVFRRSMRWVIVWVVVVLLLLVLLAFFQPHG